MRTADYDYELPARLIAQEPSPTREEARLLVLDRGSGEVSHHTVADLPDLLDPGDLLVVNDALVDRARLHGRKETGGRVEALLVERLGSARETGVAGEAELWKALVRASRTPRPGTSLEFSGGIRAVVEERLDGGAFLLRLQAPDDLAGRRARAGELPLPPYIERPGGPRLADEQRYQTVYARTPGAVAAPTAGLHLTEALLAELEERGVRRAALTLAVGPGTFRPVKEEDPRRHEMHEEAYVVSEEAAEALRRTRSAGDRIVAVGTTTTRVLETIAAQEQGPRACRGRTDLFLLPGHEFRLVDVLLTNFHLPRSTLLMLVCAFAGRRLVLDAYREAVAVGYRFYSYGDAMLIL